MISKEEFISKCLSIKEYNDSTVDKLFLDQMIEYSDCPSIIHSMSVALMYFVNKRENKIEACCKLDPKNDNSFKKENYVGRILNNGK